MSATIPLAVGRGPRSFEIGPWLVVFGVMLSLALALALGFSTSETRLLAVALLGIVAIAAAVLRPFQALLVMFASCILLVVWVVSDNKGVNPIDLLLPPLLVTGVFGTARRKAIAEDDALVGPDHRAIRTATRMLTRRVTVFYLLAILSLVILGLRGHWGWAGSSGLLLFRALQGVSLFALGMWWLRTEEDFRGALKALQVGLWALLAINVWFIIVSQIPRAAQTWVINQPDWPMTSPNEAGVTLLFVIALAYSRPKSWRGPGQIVLLVIALVMLVLTRSRSGLLAWIVYGLASMRWRLRTVLQILAAAAVAIPFVPHGYWERLANTIVPTHASFETYGTIIRLYSWQTAAKILLDNPIFGVGYMGFRFISVKYNEMKLVLNTCENYFIEVSVGMGIVGMVALGLALIALLDLHKPVLRSAPEGTFAYEMARRHRPLMLGLLAANLSGDNFMGMVCLAQVALWCVLLVRAGHLAIESGRRLAPAP